MTNEQTVTATGNEIEKLKKEYVDYLNPIVLRLSEGGAEPSMQELLRCQQLGNAYFNYVERFVGDSGLLGAHANGAWITVFAETCQNVLLAYIVHINFLRSYSAVLNGKLQEPSDNACANMQRMVKEYLPNQNWQQLSSAFSENALSTLGFNVKAVPDRKKVPIWQLVTSVSIGVISLIASVTIALIIPEPTVYQEFILRGLFAIALASIASIIPGFINLQTGARGALAYLSVYAGGAIAIFLLIWMFNPPEINKVDRVDPPSQIQPKLPKN